MMNKTLRIAAIPGDGIGKEVLPEGVRVLQAAAERWGLALSFEHFEWASCDYYAQHGAMMPDDWRAAIKAAQASRFLKDALGEDMHRTFTAIKAAEYARVMRTVSEVDFDLYLHTV